MKNVRLYAQVAGQIAGQILSGHYPLGTRLPSERELSESFEVSRPTIREALIALEVDGLVEIRMGSGVYVSAKTPPGGKFSAIGVGPFELLEARRAIEGEACAIAAARVDDEDIAELRALFDNMVAAGDDVPRAEAFDHQFHICIARATRNSAISGAVEALWQARLCSPQEKAMSEKAHRAGVGPRIDEHRPIFEALAARDPDRARVAMRSHLDKVLSALVEATEVQETAEFDARVTARRQRFGLL
ncbi:FadR/GntR family transcriptional regulator [Sphingomonas glacialis]|uniref:FadR family transcriptional regulator n=1 Tax=Sphingomonas glacialis TaxID=658225 RepID=A0A502FXS6_9SPHN|nr:FadR/GntR family transcriptional regulator [Sphingomonas glacialis]TPG53866.1 FadR family transcriptional regulator [Sphingomonas glacialis]